MLHFTRSEGWRCVTNLSDGPVALPPGEVLLSSEPAAGEGQLGLLAPDTTVWLGA